MKKLIISFKSTAAALDQVKSRLQLAEKNRGRVSPHYELSFSNLKQFKKFVSNIDVLTSIRIFKPKSIYELAKLMQKDVGNMNRLIAFFEEISIVRIEEKVVGNRNIKTPIVDYQKIEFDLVA